MPNSFTKNYKDDSNDTGFQFTFYCDHCHVGYQTELVEARGFRRREYERVFEEAQNEARRHFNRCHQCLKWVCDADFNEEENLCVECVSEINVSETN